MPGPGGPGAGLPVAQALQAAPDLGAEALELQQHVPQGGGGGKGAGRWWEVGGWWGERSGGGGGGGDHF